MKAKLAVALIGSFAETAAGAQSVAPSAIPQPRAPTRAAERPAIKYDVHNGYNLAFVDADVRRVTDAVLGKMLGVDYSIDPAVQGNITLRTSKPVSRESLVPLLEGALRSVNAVVLNSGTGYRIVPLEGARARAPIIVAGSATAAGYASEVIKLRYATAREVGRVLEQFLGKDIVGGTDEAYNQVIITGSAEERASARALIDRFDVDTLAGMNFELFKLDTVDASTLDAELKRIFQPPFGIDGRVRLVPLPRLHGLLVIALDRSDIARIEPWIRRLDTGGSGKRKLYSYSVQNGRARDLARSIQRVLGSGESGADPSETNALTQPTTSSAIPAGSAGLATQPNAATGRGASNQPTEALTPAINSPNQEAGGGATTATSGGLRVVPNDENNSLLIFANGEEYDFIRDALEKLDRPVSQVLIEATLAEVTLTNDLRYGVDFSFLQARGSAVNSTNSSAIPAAIFPGFSANLIRGSVTSVLNTLQSKTRVRVLSAPKLIVLNNQTATLQVGDQVPIITQQSQSVSSPGAPIVNNIELRDTGVILRVTPRVNDSGLVTLDIAQEVSSVAQTTTSGINSPTIQQRRISSTVATRSGEIIALGGLIREGTTRTRSGVPFLSQLPVVGGLFGQQRTLGNRTELIILMTPTIIRAPDQVRTVVNALIDGLDAVKPIVDKARKSQVGGNVP